MDAMVVGAWVAGATPAAVVVAELGARVMAMGVAVAEVGAARARVVVEATVVTVGLEMVLWAEARGLAARVARKMLAEVRAAVRAEPLVTPMWTPRPRRRRKARLRDRRCHEGFGGIHGRATWTCLHPPRARRLAPFLYATSEGSLVWPPGAPLWRVMPVGRARRNPPGRSRQQQGCSHCSS